MTDTIVYRQGGRVHESEHVVEKPRNKTFDIIENVVFWICFLLSTALTIVLGITWFVTIYNMLTSVFP